MGPARVPICSNCFQICTFSHSGELDPSLSDCESGKKKKKKSLSLTVCRAARSVCSRHRSAQISVCLPVCLSVCSNPNKKKKKSDYKITFLFNFVFWKMTQMCPKFTGMTFL